jgi:hypothetical protein
VADSETRVSVYSHEADDHGNVTASWDVVGGTSLGAPAWAALISLADEIRVANHQGTMDGATQTRPALLGLGAANYHDITVGFTGQDYNGNDVYADTGYDEITGMGSPIANVLVPNLTVAAGGQLPGGSLASGGAQAQPGGSAQGGLTPGARTSLDLGTTDAPASTATAPTSGLSTTSRSLLAAASATSPLGPALQAATTAQPAVATLTMSPTVPQAPAPSDPAPSATSSSIASIDYLLANDLLSRWDVSPVDVPVQPVVATTSIRPRSVKVLMRAAARSSSITVGAHQNLAGVRRLARGQDLSQQALKGVVVAGWSFDGGRPSSSNPSAPSTTGAVGSRAHGLTSIRNRGTRPY